MPAKNGKGFCPSCGRFMAKAKSVARTAKNVAGNLTGVSEAKKIEKNIADALSK